jgi:hypothetical protein
MRGDPRTPGKKRAASMRARVLREAPAKQRELRSEG